MQNEEVRIPARAKFDFVGQNDKEYTMKKGQSVIVTQQVDENWCIVESVNGEKSGRVPTGFVEVRYAITVVLLKQLTNLLTA